MKLWIMRIAFLFLATRGLHADTVFTTFGPGDSFLNGSSQMVGGPLQEQIAASFVPSHDFTLQSIDFAGALLSGTNSQITVDLAAGPAAPGAAIESLSVTSLPASPAVVTVDSISHPRLNAGVRYWVVLSAPDPTNTLAGWNQNDQGVVDLSSRQDGGPWLDLGTEVLTPAFDVIGSPISAVPEPSTWALLALVLAQQITTFAYRRGEHRLGKLTRP